MQSYTNTTLYTYIKSIIKYTIVSRSAWMFNNVDNLLYTCNNLKNYNIINAARLKSTTSQHCSIKILYNFIISILLSISNYELIKHTHNNSKCEFLIKY
jgi:hypothetical protein